MASGRNPPEWSSCPISKLPSPLLSREAINGANAQPTFWTTSLRFSRVPLNPRSFILMTVDSWLLLFQGHNSTGSQFLLPVASIPHLLLLLPQSTLQPVGLHPKDPFTSPTQTPDTLHWPGWSWWPPPLLARSHPRVFACTISLT